MIISSVGFAYSQSDTIPVWIKGIAEFWVEGKISDDEFLKGIEYLIENKILLVSDTSMEELKQSKEMAESMYDALKLEHERAVAENDELKKQLNYKSVNIVEAYANTEWHIDGFDFKLFGLIKGHGDDISKDNISEDNCTGWRCDYVEKDQCHLYISFESKSGEQRSPPDFCLRDIKLVTDKGFTWSPDHDSYYCQYNNVSDMREHFEKRTKTIASFTINNDESPIHSFVKCCSLCGNIHYSQ